MLNHRFLLLCYYYFSLLSDDISAGIRHIPAIPTIAYIILLIREYVPPKTEPIASIPRNPIIPQFIAPTIVNIKHIFFICISLLNI